MHQLQLSWTFSFVQPSAAAVTVQREVLLFPCFLSWGLLPKPVLEASPAKDLFQEKKYAEWSIQMKHIETWSHRMMPKVFTSITDCLNKCFEHTWAYCTPNSLEAVEKHWAKRWPQQSAAQILLPQTRPLGKNQITKAFRFLNQTVSYTGLQTARVFAKYIVSVSLQSLMRISCMTSTFSWIIST